MEKYAVLNFGSLNIDHVYRVEHFVQPGETLAAESYARFPGGKGLNQSVALARAGVAVRHAGAIGQDGRFLKELLEKEGVDCQFLDELSDVPTGHAIIQVSRSGENSIVLCGGANQKIAPEWMERAIGSMEAGDILLLQNEISGMAEIIRRAAAQGMRIYLNPAPMSAAVPDYPLELVDTLVVNETEGAALAALPADDPQALLTELRRRYPKQNLLMTLGAQGAVFVPAGQSEQLFAPACKVEQVVDTTAAGDTFIGYFIAETLAGQSPEIAMRNAAQASAYCVAHAGAAVSIPRRNMLVMKDGR